MVYIEYTLLHKQYEVGFIHIVTLVIWSRLCVTLGIYIVTHAVWSRFHVTYGIHIVTLVIWC